MLETGVVPPVANFQEVDPELGTLNLSRGGSYPVHYALRLAAGFGSQISMSLLQWTPPPDGARRSPRDLGFRHRIRDVALWGHWLRRVTGYEAPEVEVVERTLRVRDEGPTPALSGGRAVPARRDDPSPRPERGATPGVLGPGAQAPAAIEMPPQPPTDRGATEQPSTPLPDAGGTEAPRTAAPPAPSRAEPPPASGVRERVLAIVSEQTGYPVDMLELDLDLEADLGIDTVKQAEMFAAIREAYGIERDETLALRDYPTLERAIEFVFEKRPDLREGGPPGAGAAGETAAAPGSAAGAATPDTSTTSTSSFLRGSMAAAQAVPRRVPFPRLRPPAERFRPTGVELARGDRVLVMADRGGVAAALVGRLEKRGVAALVVDDAPEARELV
ncbi:MAG TPA: phosphopantetheine-binding protein, partial [Longimicrobiales bacterium]|nr:phosphopantetheine-binding protein [Longimicrobiales bacterium]